MPRSTPDPAVPWLHVMNRAVARRPAFASPGDVGAFLAVLAEALPDAALEVHAYCLLGTHYHLLVRARPERARPVVTAVERRFARALAVRHATPERLFPAAHRALPVGDGRHVLHVSRYIHLNPVAAGLARRPEAWPHSSYRAYLDPFHAPAWLRTADLLARLGTLGARQRYRRFVEEGLDPGTRDRFGRPALRRALGGEDRAEGILERAIAVGVPPGPRVGPAPGPVLDAVAEAFGFDGAAAMRAPRGGAAGALARGAAVLVARRAGIWTLREIAVRLGYRSEAGARRALLRFAAAVERDPALACRIDQAVAGMRFMRPLTFTR